MELNLSCMPIAEVVDSNATMFDIDQHHGSSFDAELSFQRGDSEDTLVWSENRRTICENDNAGLSFIEARDAFETRADCRCDFGFANHGNVRENQQSIITGSGSWSNGLSECHRIEVFAVAV